MSRLATHCKFEKLVVAGVVTVADADFNLDPLGCTCQESKKLPCFLLSDVRAEFIPAEHFVKLYQNRQGEEDRATVQGKVERAAGC